MQKKDLLKTISPKECTPLVDALLCIIEQQSKELAVVHAEIKRLKNLSQKPNIKPSKLEKDDDGSHDSDKSSGSGGGGKRPGSSKKSKKNRKIDETKIVGIDNLPEGSRFKGYRDYDVQELEIIVKNVRYRLERWKLPNGDYMTAKLPKAIAGYHFGPTLRSYALYQNNDMQTTQPALLTSLRDFGADISSGELNRILTEDKQDFHKEKVDVLRAGLAHSSYIQTDDTGARHKGKNGYCTHIGNPFFAYFASRASKSRVNFLELLRAGFDDYVFNETAETYLRKQKLPEEHFNTLRNSQKHWSSKEEWEGFLAKIGMTEPSYMKMMTEAHLLGSVIEHGFLRNCVIVSDDAGQFNVLDHALCWVHAERALTRLIPETPSHDKSVGRVLNRFWALYKVLKKYKEKPTSLLRMYIEKEFDEMCLKKVGYASLKASLKRLHKNKSELLMVLNRPDIPLHNNLSENDIRQYVKKRKISGGTRSILGRESRDTFASIKKTCKKLQISLWDYLRDRIFQTNQLPNLSTLVHNAIVNANPA